MFKKSSWIIFFAEQNKNANKCAIPALLTYRNDEDNRNRVCSNIANIPHFLEALA